MNHQGTKTLESERLLLRRFTIDDAQAMYDNWANDSDVTKYLSWPTHTSVEISRNVLTDWDNKYKNNDVYNWAIVLKSRGNEPIGSIGVVHKNDTVNRLLYRKGMVETRNNF